MYEYDVNGNELKYGTANNRLMKIVRTRFDTDPGQQSSSFGEPTGGDLLATGGGGVTAAAPGRGGFPPPETSTKLWTKYYFYSSNGDVLEDGGTIERIVTKDEVGNHYTAIRLGYGTNERTVTHVLGEKWDWSDTDPDPAPPSNYTVTFARQFRYDGARQRYLDRELDRFKLMENPEVYESRSDTWSDYDGNSIYADFESDAGTVTNLRSYIPGLAITDQLTGGGPANTTYLHTSALGSTMATSTSSGVGIFDMAYTAFGEQIMGQTQRYGFAGEWDYQSHDDFDYMHLGHRYYNPATGRFLQRDPIGIAGGGECLCLRAEQPSVLH